MSLRCRYLRIHTSRHYPTHNAANHSIRNLSCCRYDHLATSSYPSTRDYATCASYTHSSIHKRNKYRESVVAATCTEKHTCLFGYVTRVIALITIAHIEDCCLHEHLMERIMCTHVQTGHFFIVPLSKMLLSD